MKTSWLILMIAAYCSSSSLAQTLGQTQLSGFSDQYRSHNTLGEYTFGYNEDHSSGGSFRRETSDRFGNKIGSYGLRVADGRVRIVNYVADRNGFRADVVSNEPGMQSQDSNEHSKITKKSIYRILVPGFRYSSAAPHLTFGADHESSSNPAEVENHYAVLSYSHQGEGVSETHSNDIGSENNLFSSAEGNAQDVEELSGSLQEEGLDSVNRSQNPHYNDEYDAKLSYSRYSSGVGETHSNEDGIQRNLDSNAEGSSEDNVELLHLHQEEGLDSGTGRQNIYSDAEGGSTDSEGISHFNQEEGLGGGDRSRSTVYSNVDESFRNIFSDPHSESSELHTNKGEHYDDGTTGDEYGDASARVSLNQTADSLVNKEVYGQKVINKDTSTTDDPISTTLHEGKGGYSDLDAKSSDMNTGLQTHESEVILSKSSELINQHDKINTSSNTESKIDEDIKTHDASILS